MYTADAQHLAMPVAGRTSSGKASATCSVCQGSSGRTAPSYLPNQALRVAADRDVPSWAESVGTVYPAAQDAVAILADAPAEASLHEAARRQLMTELQAVCAPYLDDGTAPQRVLRRRMAKQMDALFVFVLDPAVVATNNATERSLRN